MKNSLATIILCFLTSLGIAQGTITLNGGGTSQKNYYSEIDYESSDGTPVVKVIIGGKTYRFILDTGAPNVISKELLEKLPPANINRNGFKKEAVWDASDKVDSLNIITLSGIKLGNVVFDNIPTLVMNDQFLFDCYRFDGVIGSNMLRNSIIQISSKTRKLILTDQPEKLQLKNKPSDSLYLDYAQSTPSVFVNMMDIDTVDMPMVFDTGDRGFFSLALNHYKVLEKGQIFKVLGKSTGSTGVSAHGIERDTTLYNLRARELRLHGALFKNTSMLTTPAEESRIGAKLLNYGVVTLAYSTRKFYFEPFQSAVDLLIAPFPVMLGFKKDKVTIGTIWDEKLKDRISVGDSVLALDDQDISRFTLCDLVKATTIFDEKNEILLTLKNLEGKVNKIKIARQ
ncbi:MAG: retropepsin-like aspartic protease [Bacteroidota bacterium]